jgi:hypothetical protein
VCSSDLWDALLKFFRQSVGVAESFDGRCNGGCVIGVASLLLFMDVGQQRMHFRAHPHFCLARGPDRSDGSFDVDHQGITHV